MQRAEVVVIGSGPAGLCAAVEAARAGARVVLLDENQRPGGQLFKQIHRFFGTADHHAGRRGYQIGRELLAEVESAGVDVRLGTTVWGAFEGLRLGCASEGRPTYHLAADRLILATGASELAAAFPGWTLPGVMGAGAAQTLMNLHRVRPGTRALMVGSGNVGLIVSYQLLQAGVEVAAVVETAERVGGWEVHAARLRRTGVPILTGHTVTEAMGEGGVERARIAPVGETSPGHEVEVDLICLAVGLRPQTQLAGMLGLEIARDPRGAAPVPRRDESMRSSDERVYIAGDMGAISEASIAMEQGRIAGRAAAASLGHGAQAQTDRIITEARERIELLDVTVEPSEPIAPMPMDGPGPRPVVECYQRIPCNPCEAACLEGLITVGLDPTEPPTTKQAGCTGCMRCVRACPGMAIFVVEELPEREECLVSLPWELPGLPERGQTGTGLDRAGRPVCEVRVARVRPARRVGDTAVLTLAVPRAYADDVRGFGPRATEA